MWRDALLVAQKDLRVELRSRVATNQVVPFALVVLVLFAFALDPSTGLLRQAAPGLYWVAVCFAAVLATQRSFSLEPGGDALRCSGLDAAGVFLGKAIAVALQLALLQAVLTAGVVVLYGVSLRGGIILLGAGLATTVGLAASGVLYGLLTGGIQVRETLLPLLLLPVLAPVLLSATRVWAAALAGTPSFADPWLSLLAVFAAVYTAAGIVAFPALMEVS
jgi:heme exporter protein B